MTRIWHANEEKGVVVRSAAMDDLPIIADVVRQAFGSKMRIIFGSDPARTNLLIAKMLTSPIKNHYDGILCAELEGRIAGALVIEPAPYSQEDIAALEDLTLKELGFLRAMWANFVLGQLSYNPREDEAYISDVGVLPECQGRGIGHALMYGVETWVGENPRQRMSLLVHADNLPAIHLYKRHGFEIARSSYSLVLHLLVRMPRWYFMIRQLSPLPTIADVDA